MSIAMKTKIIQREVRDRIIKIKNDSEKHEMEQKSPPIKSYLAIHLLVEQSESMSHSDLQKWELHVISLKLF